MRLQSTSLSIGAALLVLPLMSPAQPSAHYVPGVEGIKGASLPPPGIYLRDYNVAYYSEQLNDSSGNSIGGLNPRAFIYANVPRVIWITPCQVLGGYLGVDALVPLQYTSLRLGGFHDQTFGIGDAFAEGTWSRHWKQLDVSAGYGAWAPTGSSSSPGHNPTRAGLGYWTHMFTAGATYYPDAAKKWSASALSRYEINMEHEGLTVGQAYTLEWGLSRAIIPTIDAGLAGYYQQQVTSDNNGSPLNRVAGIGPEISAFCPKCAVGVSLRYAYEFMAENRLEGHTVALTITKRF
jgi:hypothetical protein